MDFVDSAEPLLPKRVGLLTTTQFRHWLPAIKDHLEKKGHVIRIGEPDRRGADAGQLLGCGYYTAAGVEKGGDGHLFICTRELHPPGGPVPVRKTGVLADPSRGAAPG